MFEFNPRDHKTDNCVECGEDLPLDIAPPAVTIDLDGEVLKIGGLYRCAACQAFIEIGAIRSQVDLKAAHARLQQSIIPYLMVRTAEAEQAVAELAAVGAMGTREGQSKFTKIMMWMATAGPELIQQAELCDKLDAHFGVDSMPIIQERGADILREEATPEVEAMSESDLDDLINALELKREPDGSVTYACPNPTCPEGNRHPISFAEPILPDRIVAALIGRLPE